MLCIFIGTIYGLKHAQTNGGLCLWKHTTESVCHCLCWRKWCTGIAWYTSHVPRKVGSSWVLPITQNFRYVGWKSMKKSVLLRSDQNIWNHFLRWSTLTGQTKINCSISTNCLGALLISGTRDRKGLFHLIGQFNQKMLFHFTTVGPCWSYQLYCENGKHPQCLVPVTNKSFMWANLRGHHNLWQKSKLIWVEGICPTKLVELQ